MTDPLRHLIKTVLKRANSESQHFVKHTGTLNTLNFRPTFSGT